MKVGRGSQRKRVLPPSKAIRHGLNIAEVNIPHPLHGRQKLPQFTLICDLSSPNRERTPSLTFPCVYEYLVQPGWPFSQTE